MEEISRERAQTLMREGDLEGAVAMLKEVTTQTPGDAMAWQLMGGALGALGNTDESIGAFQQAAELQPTSARVHFNLAVALIKSDRSTEARSHLERALALDPGYEQARTRLKELGGIAADTATPPPPDPTLGGGPAATRPAAPAPLPSPPPAPPAASAGTPPPLGTVGAPATPKPAAPALASAATPPGISLQPIGGGLGSIGGGDSTPAAPPPPAGGAPAAPGGMAGMGSIGGGGTAPAPPPPPQGAPMAPPPSMGPGGYTSSPGGYRSPDVPDAPKRYAPDVNAGNILTMAIVSIFCFGLILGPYAIFKANEGLKILAEYPEDTQAPKGTLTAALVIAIISTVLATIVVGFRLIVLISVLSGKGS